MGAWNIRNANEQSTGRINDSRNYIRREWQVSVFGFQTGVKEADLSAERGEWRKNMKKYIAKFFRYNPQIRGGGYETEREIEAKTISSARKRAREIENNCLYGSMTLIDIKLADEQEVAE